MKGNLRLIRQVAEKCHSKFMRMSTPSSSSLRGNEDECDVKVGTASSSSSVFSSGDGVGKVEGVKKGHFAVVARRDGEAKRFVVGLSCLRNPAFIRLLDEAEEEFGWQQQGVLSVLCQPSELEDILAANCRMERQISDDSKWSRMDRC
ncbi:Auxin-responsive protein [Nymphaea thermarum]|nr:Auxin-responsive protein [Nymphaea thermarum]